MDGQCVVNLKWDLNTEGTEDTEKTGENKRKKRIITEGAETQRRRSRFLAARNDSFFLKDGFLVMGVF
jgi:hypothetical protein